MSNTFVNPTVVAAETLRQLENNCVMAELVHKGYKSEWDKKHGGYEPGQTITLKCPTYSRVSDGATMNVVDVYNRSTTFTLGYRKHVAHKVTAEEATYNDSEFIEHVIQPAARALANYIDLTLLSLYKDIPNQVGTPGTTPSTFLSFALANAKLSDHAAPMGDRRVVVNPLCQAYMADHLKGLYNADKAAKAVEKAQFANNFAGFDWYVSQNVANHTCGTAAGLTTNLVDDTVAEGDTSINIDQNGSWSGTFTEGDIFTVASVYGVNPITGLSTGQLRQFVVDAAVSGDASDCIVTCTPGTSPYQMYSASAAETYLPYQNMDALPANNAAVTVEGTASLVHPVNLAFHKDCLGLAMVPLNIDRDVAWSASETYKGYTITVTKDFDITNYQTYIRFDVLFGVKTLNPFLGCRIAG